MRGGTRTEGRQVDRDVGQGAQCERLGRELGASSYRIQDYQTGIQSTYPTTQRFVYAIVEFDAGR